MLKVSIKCRGIPAHYEEVLTLRALDTKEGNNFISTSAIGYMDEEHT